MATHSAGSVVLPDQPVFAATLTPHRSLSPLGFRIVMAIIIAGALVQAVPMVVMGAWPVGWFFGLDVLILYLCFRLSFARSRRSEQVVLSRVELLVRKFGWRGDVDEKRFNPFWVRLRTEEDPDYGMQRLVIVQRRDEVEIGAFLAPFEKADFARQFGLALARVKA
jgi:uncharacterized membrane protein